MPSGMFQYFLLCMPLRYIYLPFLQLDAVHSQAVLFTRSKIPTLRCSRLLLPLCFCPFSASSVPLLSAHLWVVHISVHANASSSARNGMLFSHIFAPSFIDSPSQESVERPREVELPRCSQVFTVASSSKYFETGFVDALRRVPGPSHRPRIRHSFCGEYSPNSVHCISTLASCKAQFLPWHRQYVKVYETALREECGYHGAHPSVSVLSFIRKQTRAEFIYTATGTGR